jgi:hypothetical protein
MFEITPHNVMYFFLSYYIFGFIFACFIFGWENMPFMVSKTIGDFIAYVFLWPLYFMFLAIGAFCSVFMGFIMISRKISKMLAEFFTKISQE